MPFDLKVSGGFFQGRLHRVLRLVHGVLGIADDIVIHSATENTHDGTVLALCKTARLNNLSLNSKKMQLKSTDCKFFGHRLTPDGIKVDPEKIEAIIQMDPPQNVANLQSFNGMAYWSGINKDILKHYQNCKTGIKYSKSQRSESLQSHPTPEVSWHTVATDLFETKNSKYLLIVDYYSRFPVLCKLGSTTSRVLVQKMKAKLGVPNVIVSEGGPQYTSAEFRDFTKHWQIEVSSPRNHQSNGMAERCVQTMKASLIKTIKEGEDMDLVLLTYKTTPLNHRLPLPAELLNSRKYKTLLPTWMVPTRLQES